MLHPNHLTPTFTLTLTLSRKPQPRPLALTLPASMQPPPFRTQPAGANNSSQVLLKPKLNLRLLPYCDGRSAPQAHGTHAKRAFQTAVTTGPYAVGRGTAGADGGGADGDAGGGRVEVVGSLHLFTICPATQTHPPLQNPAA